MPEKRGFIREGCDRRSEHGQIVHIRARGHVLSFFIVTIVTMKRLDFNGISALTNCNLMTFVIPSYNFLGNLGFTLNTSFFLSIPPLSATSHKVEVD